MHKVIIANWKMQLMHNEAIQWLSAHISSLNYALEESNNRIILCPSFAELAIAAKYTANRILLGAQDCSAYERGAYTGEVSALSLHELGCTYAIIGHSERRSCGETDLCIALKAALLNKHAITPIICIGETEKERHNGETFAVLERQLADIKKLIDSGIIHTMLIAYEPVWAIGTQQLPRAIDISQVFTWLDQFLKKTINPIEYKFLYGGNVNERTIIDLGLTVIDGFLLGRASIDAEVLKKIILSC